MYISCSVAFTLTSSSQISCIGSISEFDDLADISGFVVTCSDKFVNQYSSTRCFGDFYSSDDYSTLTVGHYFLQMNSYDGIDNEYYDPLVFNSVSGLSNELIEESVTDTVDETVEDTSSSTSILDLTSAEYDELSSYFVIVLLAAFSIRMIKKMFIKG